ncbi:MAG: hypothetical protein FJ033_00325 [Chloroflexi bacterium]|nr:hypothetical protein [Chloroflexota bacterium]
MSEEAESRVQPIAGTTGYEIEMASALQAADLDRDWSTRRLEIYRALDAAVQQSVASVLQAAAETRQAMEAEAKQVLDRLRHERSRLIEDIREYRRQRDGLSAEISDARRRAEEEASRIKRAAEAEKTGMLRDAENRKVELTAEIQRLEQQLADVSSGIQSLLQEQIGRVRAEVSTPARRPPERPARVVEQMRPPPSSRTPSSPAPIEGSAREQEPQPTVRTSAPPPPAEPVVRAYRSAGDIAESADDRPSAGGHRDPAVPVSAPPTELAPPRVASTPSVVREAPDPPPSTISTASVAPPTPTTAAGGPVRIEVAVVNTPSFARALEFQRGVQRTEGVRQVQALQFEGGRLVLAVEHDAALDLATAVSRLPGFGVALVGRDASRLEFAFPATT